jgi:hypothetical protein
MISGFQTTFNSLQCCLFVKQSQKQFRGLQRLIALQPILAAIENNPFEMISPTENGPDERALYALAVNSAQD